jgi:hypothetical protein
MAAEVAEAWFSRLEGAGLDGVVVKPLDLPYVVGVPSLASASYDQGTARRLSC